MKHAIGILAILICSVNAFAGTLSCSGEQLSLSEIRPDGGPAMIPTIQLVLYGDVLINEGLGKPNTRSASYFLDGEPVKFSEVRKGDYKILYFSQQFIVNDTAIPSGELFSAEVVCRQEIYLGPPRP